MLSDDRQVPECDFPGLAVFNACDSPFLVDAPERGEIAPGTHGTIGLDVAPGATVILTGTVGATAIEVSYTRPD
jgi:hypothetical protein